VVAVLDTGIGAHRWFGPDFVTDDVTVLGRRIGIDPVSTMAELHGISEQMVGELDVDAGHGTFIAGLIRQACPEARMLDIQTYGNDGRVAESNLLRCLQLLALRQVLARNGSIAEEPVDIVTLSLGYYHEQPEDTAFDALLAGPLRLLGRHGAAVVVSAGNDATSRPLYPAAFAPHHGGPVPEVDDEVRITTVGALNPDGSIALFSNDGPWVRYLRPGASLVSTFPETYDASANPANEVLTRSGEVRAALDPDDFSSGFGVWSGTSFAAPVFAGELAAALARAYAAGDDALDNGVAVKRMRRLLEERETGRPATGGRS
jgi:subtilisin family serine protease